MFARREAEKRAKQIAVRVNQEETEAIEWMAAQLSGTEEGQILPTDVARIALGRLYKDLSNKKAQKKPAKKR